jgi:hypothetical protein
MINEFMVSLYLYSLMVLFLFGQGKYPEIFREAIGWVLISIVISSVCLNFLNFLWSIMKLFRLQFLKWYYTKCRKAKKDVDDLPPVFIDSEEDNTFKLKPFEEDMDDRFAHHIDNDEHGGQAYQIGSRMLEKKYIQATRNRMSALDYLKELNKA